MKQLAAASSLIPISWKCGGYNMLQMSLGGTEWVGAAVPLPVGGRGGRGGGGMRLEHFPAAPLRRVTGALNIQ